MLLLDEPGSNLDTNGTDALLNALKTLRSRSTILVATHDPDPYRPLADHIHEVRDTKIRSWGANA